MLFFHFLLGLERSTSGDQCSVSWLRALWNHGHDEAFILTASAVQLFYFKTSWTLKSRSRSQISTQQAPQRTIRLQNQKPNSIKSGTSLHFSYLQSEVPQGGETLNDSEGPGITDAIFN
ncbi:hypothetical protein SRHO_G00060080 [Serrasalmus rhombeus]